MAIETGVGLGGGFGSVLSLAGAAVASNIASSIAEQMVEIDGGWEIH